MFRYALLLLLNPFASSASSNSYSVDGNGEQQPSVAFANASLDASCDNCEQFTLFPELKLELLSSNEDGEVVGDAEDEDENEDDDEDKKDEEFEVCQDESCMDLGEEQDMTLCDPDLADACEKRYDESYNYVLSLLQDPDTPDELKMAMPRCKNRLEECTYYAVKGKCEDDRFLKAEGEVYMDMFTDCGPACFSCDKLLYKNRCSLDPNRPRAWAPGDLNRFFLNVTTLAKFTHYEAKVWSRPTYKEGDTAETADYQLGPWIVSLDNFATEQECQRLIALGNKEGYVRSDDEGEYLPDGSYVTYFTEERTSYQAWCEDCPSDPIARGVSDRIEVLTSIPFTNSEPLQLLRYTKGQKYDVHHDLDPGDLYRQQGVRLMTLFLYLNDVEEGGQTRFPQLNLTFTPKRGRIVIWPNVLDEDPDEEDPRTEHQAMPVIKGVKYSANSWTHQHDVLTPMYENCRD